MTGGFATVAGGVMAIYILLLRDYIPSIAGHLIAASVMNAPAGLLLSKIILPETGKPVTGGSLEISVERTQSNVIDAAADGASTGAKLAINIAAMMMAFFALIALLNALISWGGGLVGLQGLSIESMIGQAVRPLVWLMGVPWADTTYVGTLMGVKVVLTELVAYTRFASDMTGGLAAIQPRSMIIATYALLGFANLPSIAIQIGGISGLAPSRRSELSKLGLRAMIAGNLAAFMSACLAGMLV
jgi:CNT family concentrative nucleoside transporter